MSTARFEKFAHCKPGVNTQIVSAQVPRFPRDQLLRLTSRVLQGFEADGVAKMGKDLKDLELLYYLHQRLETGKSIYQSDDLVRMARRRTDGIWELSMELVLRAGGVLTVPQAMLHLADAIANGARN